MQFVKTWSALKLGVVREGGGGLLGLFPGKGSIFCLKISRSVASLELTNFASSRSLLSPEFSLSKYAARRAIWFSFSLLASLDLLAATLFLPLLSQYLSSLQSSETNIFCRFLIIGWGLSSSTSKALSLGSKSSPGTVARARSSVP